MNKLPERIRIKDIARLAKTSVGTVDRVLHKRSGVSEASKKKVEAILKQLNYQPNMYASALASNKKYNFVCMLPKHQEGEYWTDVEKGIYNAVQNYSDFNVSVQIEHYDPYDYYSFTDLADDVIAQSPDGVIVAPTIPQYSIKFITQLQGMESPYIYIDSQVEGTRPLSFFGQNSYQSGYFAARMLMLLGRNATEIVIFRKMHRGIIGSNQQASREIGFRKYMGEHFPSCKIHELDLSADDNADDSKMLDDFFTAHPRLDTGITFNSKVYVIGEYLQSRPNIRFNLIGYDLLDRNVACLQNRSVAFLIAQQPELQGFNSIKTLCDHLILKKKDIVCNNYMPIDLLTVENIDFYHPNF